MKIRTCGRSDIYLSDLHTSCR